MKLLISFIFILKCNLEVNFAPQNLHSSTAIYKGPTIFQLLPLSPYVLSFIYTECVSSFSYSFPPFLLLLPSYLPFSSLFLFLNILKLFCYQLCFYNSLHFSAFSYSIVSSFFAILLFKTHDGIEELTILFQSTKNGYRNGSNFHIWPNPFYRLVFNSIYYVLFAQ